MDRTKCTAEETKAQVPFVLDVVETISTNWVISRSKHIKLAVQRLPTTTNSSLFIEHVRNLNNISLCAGILSIYFSNPNPTVNIKFRKSTNWKFYYCKYTCSDQFSSKLKPLLTPIRHGDWLLRESSLSFAAHFYKLLILMCLKSTTSWK